MIVTILRGMVYHVPLQENGVLGPSYDRALFPEININSKSSS